MACNAVRVEAQFLLTPSARAILGTNTVPDSLLGTGRAGRITKADALQFLQRKQQPQQPVAKAAVTPKPSPPPTTSRLLPPSLLCSSLDFHDVPVSTMRRVIGTRLAESKHALPHAYATMDVKIDRCLELRAQFKQLQMLPVPSMNDLVIKASALAVHQLTTKDQGPADISVAVATKSGLITPIVRAADAKRLSSISREMKDLAGRAKDNKLKPSEFQGGAFTVSNLGMLGISDFTAIINLPQSAILAVGAGRPVLQVPKGNSKDKVIPLHELTKSDTYMSVTLSYDAANVDPITASRFLQTFRAAIEAPACLV